MMIILIMMIIIMIMSYEPFMKYGDADSTWISLNIFYCTVDN
jgi:hypothetical protein